MHGNMNVKYTNERIVLYVRVTAVTSFRCNFSLRQNETRQQSTFTQFVLKQVVAVQHREDVLQVHSPDTPSAAVTCRRCKVVPNKIYTMYSVEGGGGGEDGI
jgi:hypothetical protein